MVSRIQNRRGRFTLGKQSRQPEFNSGGTADGARPANVQSVAIPPEGRRGLLAGMRQVYPSSKDSKWFAALAASAVVFGVYDLVL